MENKIIDGEIQNNNVDNYKRRNNLKISRIPQSVSEHQLEENVVDILKAIDVNITSNEIEACNRLGKKEGVTVWIVYRHYELRKISSPSIKML